MNKNVPKRIVIYTKDIVNITGKKRGAASLMMQRMRRQLGKKKEQFLTVDEFCELSGITKDTVYANMKN